MEVGFHDMARSSVRCRNLGRRLRLRSPSPRRLKSTSRYLPNTGWAPKPSHAYAKMWRRSIARWSGAVTFPARNRRARSRKETKQYDRRSHIQREGALRNRGSCSQVERLERRQRWPCVVARQQRNQRALVGFASERFHRGALWSEATATGKPCAIRWRVGRDFRGASCGPWGRSRGRSGASTSKRSAKTIRCLCRANRGRSSALIPLRSNGQRLPHV
jgi:hypothetical protein